MSTVFYLLAGLAALGAVACLSLIQRSAALLLPTHVLEIQLGIVVLIAVMCLAAGAILSRLDALVRHQGP